MLSKLRTMSMLSRFLVGFFMLILVYIVVVLVQKIYSPSDDSNLNAQQESSASAVAILDVKDFAMLPYPDTEEGREAAFGEQLILHTAKYLGPENKEGEVFSGNNLACASCHLNGGKTPYAAPYIGLSSVYPMFSGRDGKVASLEERINGCFERSMNGRALPVDSREMLAMVSYINHLSSSVAVDGRIEGQGFVSLELPDRKADLVHGGLVFAKHCAVCHQQDGQGIPRNAAAKSDGYIYPPLWGDDSYNDGAGMGRMITAAKFIKGNMPLGATKDRPMLTDEEAYDVAAYINSFERPSKANKELDYPDLAKKPKDSAYPPFADTISAEQHKYGPFNF